VKTFTAVVEKCPDTGLYTGYIPGFPGAHSQGDSLDELRRNLEEVVAMLLEDVKAFDHRLVHFSTWGTAIRKTGGVIITSRDRSFFLPKFTLFVEGMVDFYWAQPQVPNMKYRVVVEVDEDGVFVAECPALPGCVSQGKTRQEALANIQGAMQGYVASLKKHGELGYLFAEP
jgi:antitoxin HicB